MKSFWMFLIASFLAAESFAQDVCPEYKRLMEEAKSYFDNGNYKKALLKYNSAKTCSPSNRTEVDSSISRIYEKIDRERLDAIAAKKVAVEATTQANKMNQQLVARNLKDKIAADSIKQRNKVLEEARIKDSIRITDDFIARHKKLVDTVLTVSEKNELLATIIDLYHRGRNDACDTLMTSLQLWKDAIADGNVFSDYLKKNFDLTTAPKFFEDKATYLSDLGCVAFDIYYYRAQAKINQSLSMLPSSLGTNYKSRIQNSSADFKSRRQWMEQNYWLPDTVIGVSADTIFALTCADNQNFVFGYTSYEDYKKLQLRYLNLSVRNFSFTTDSLVQLSPAGKFYRVLAADGNYRYMVVKETTYSLKKNLVQYKTLYDTYPTTIKLINKQGKVLNDFSGYDPFGYFFNPDANFLATWKSNSISLVLYNLTTQKFWPLPASDAAPTMSFSPDAKSMAYYNSTTKNFYFIDLTGTAPVTTSILPAEVPGISNIDFAGNNNFLKINANDSIYLFDINKKKVLFRFHKDFVKNIIVAPNGKDVLITCYRNYTYSGFLTYCVDMDLNIKERIYADCDNFFFSPDGKFLVGYDQYVIMRWHTDKTEPAKSSRNCLSFTTFVERECLPFDYYQQINDASSLEQGARKLFSMGSYATDPILRGIYLQQSQNLFDRLKTGNVQNLRKDRIPFFYDWSNLIGKNNLNKEASNLNTDPGNQTDQSHKNDFISTLYYATISRQVNMQQEAVEIFDDLVNSRDSIYPQQLYYAANGNMLLSDLYDSLQSYTLTHIDLIKKEISLRERVLNKDPDNGDNIFYLKKAFQKLSNTYDSAGWRKLQKWLYSDRLSLYRSDENYFSSKLRSLPDSLGLKPIYINVLAQLAPSYLYVYASKPNEYPFALDSALYFTDKALALSPSDKFDSARLLIIKARAYLLKENGLQKALELYRLMRTQFPNQISKEGLLRQLRFLREAGSQNPNIDRAEEFLKQEVE